MSGSDLLYLDWHVSKGDIDKVAQLLRDGTSPNLTAALLRAVANHNPKMVRLILFHGGSRDIGRAISLAINSGDLESFKDLISVDEHPSYILHLREAVAQGKSDFAELILDSWDDNNGTYIHAYNDSIELAVRRGYTNIVRMILDRVPNMGEHRLIYTQIIAKARRAAEKTDYSNITRLLRNYQPMNPNTITRGGITNLMSVAQNGPTHRMYRMLQDSEDLDAQDDYGNTALHYAVDAVNVRRAQILVEMGANPHLENDEGLTPIDLVLDLETEEDDQHLREEVARERYVPSRVHLLMTDSQKMKNLFRDEIIRYYLSRRMPRDIVNLVMELLEH